MQKLSVSEKENLRQFINDIYGDSLTNDDLYFIGPDYKYMRAYKTTTNIENIYKRFVNEIENQKHNLCYNSQTFYYLNENNRIRRKQENIKSIKTFYIDIDHIEVSNLRTNEEVKEYLYNNYPFLKEIGLFPQYVCLSGHGLHLYFILKNAFQFVTLDDKQRQNKVNETRKNMWKNTSLKLCGLFNSDSRVSCDISKILRIPYSYNMKDSTNPIRTTLFNFSNEYAALSYEELKAKIEPLISLEEQNKIDCKTKLKTIRAQREHIEEPYYYDDITISDIKEYYKNYKENSKHDRTFKNILYFLEEVLLPHRNYDIQGYRHSFIFCVAKIYQNNNIDYEYTLNHCLSVNNKLIDKLTNNEIKDIVYYIYNPNNKFRYTYKTIRYNREIREEKTISKCKIKLSNKSIKNLLDITSQEQNLCHMVSFYEEHKELKSKILNEIKNSKHKENNIYYEKKKLTKEQQIEFIKLNPDMSIEDIASNLNLSIKTIKRRIKEIK